MGINVLNSQKKDGIPVPQLQEESVGGAVVKFPEQLKGKVSLVLLGLRGTSHVESRGRGRGGGEWGRGRG